MSTPRRSSLGMLLRRSKSTDLKKQAKERKRNGSVSKDPPRLPQLYNGAPPTQLFGTGDVRPDSLAIASGRAANNNAYSPPRASMDPGRGFVSVPPPPIPTGAWADPYARNESMTHRGRYSYASSAISSINNPRKVRRRKDPTPFNILIVGSRSSGKTSFLEFLKTALALPAKKRYKSTTEHELHPPRALAFGNFIPHYLETEIDGERVGLTLWDSEGFEKNVVDLQLREMSSFLESKFEETFNEEMKVMRSPGAQDTHIHAAFLVLDPARLDKNMATTRDVSTNGQHAGKQQIASSSGRGLDEDLDLQVIRTLQGKTTVIPVISKADTITTKHMNVLKRTVWDGLKKANLDPLELLGLDYDEDSTPDTTLIAEESEHVDSGHSDGEAPEGDDLPIQGHGSPKSKRLSSNSVRRNKVSEDVLADGEIPYVPMSIISPDIYEPGVVGRQFPWGFADPYNAEHCDFQRLKDSVFSEWRGELREASRDQWYEGWRTSRLKQREAPAHAR